MIKKNNITIVTDRYWPSRGGMEQAAYALSATLPDTWSVKVVTHRTSRGHSLHATFSSHQSLPHTDPSGRTIHPLTPGIWGRVFLLPLLVWNIPFLRKIIAKNLYDNLYFWYKLSFFNSLDKLLAGSDVVHCISTGYLARCVTDVCLKNGLRFIHQPFIHFDRWGDSLAQLRAYATADAVLCPTESFKRKFLEKTATDFPIHAIVIPPIIIEPHYPKLQVPPVPGRFILFIGRREAHKGLSELLVAFSGLDHLASLVIAGPGEQIRVRNMAVFDLGEVDDPIKMWLLASCDIFCLPSTDESFGMAFAEAMSMGKPIVAFDIPPINEIVKNGRNGLLVPPEETGCLHQALELLLSDDHMKEAMGRESRRQFEMSFTSSTVIGKITTLYRTLGASAVALKSDTPAAGKPIKADTRH